MKNHSLLYFLIFICSLMLGYSISIRFYPTTLDIRPSTLHLAASGNQNPIETMKTGQRSMLLISATAIDMAHTELKGIWLASYFTTDTTIQLLPIYPTGNPLHTNFEQQLTQSFGFVKRNKTLVVNQTFINLLKNENYWWSGYIVFDESAMKQISNLINGNNLALNTLTDRTGVEESSNTVLDSQAAFATQIALLQSVCQKFREISVNAGLLSLYSKLPKHTVTDMDPSQLQDEVQSFFSQERKPTCRFPTMEISMFVH
jgi:hypothetical protein